MHERSNDSPVWSKTTLASINRERSNSPVTLRSSTNSSATTPLSDAATITSPRDVLPNAYLIKSLITAPRQFGRLDTAQCATTSVSIRCLLANSRQTKRRLAGRGAAHKSPGIEWDFTQPLLRD